MVNALQFTSEHLKVVLSDEYYVASYFVLCLQEFCVVFIISKTQA